MWPRRMHNKEITGCCDDRWLIFQILILYVWQRQRGSMFNVQCELLTFQAHSISSSPTGKHIKGGEWNVIHLKKTKIKRISSQLRTFFNQEIKRNNLISIILYSSKATTRYQSFINWLLHRWSERNRNKTSQPINRLRTIPRISWIGHGHSTNMNHNRAHFQTAEKRLSTSDTTGDRWVSQSPKNT